MALLDTVIDAVVGKAHTAMVRHSVDLADLEVVFGLDTLAQLERDRPGHDKAFMFDLENKRFAMIPYVVDTATPRLMAVRVKRGKGVRA